MSTLDRGAARDPYKRCAGPAGPTTDTRLGPTQLDPTSHPQTSADVARVCRPVTWKARMLFLDRQIGDEALPGGRIDLSVTKVLIFAV